MLFIFQWIALLSAISLVASAAFAEGKSETCTVLRQYDYKLGEIVVCLGERHARVDCMNGRCTIIAAAPDWRVTVFNKDKQFISADRKRWHEFGIEGVAKSRRWLFENTRLPMSRVKFLGRNSVQVSRVLYGDLAEGFDIAFQSKKKKQAEKSMSRTATETASSDFAFNTNINEFVEGLYLTPSKARVFLSSVSAEPGITRTTFGTHSIRRETFPIDYFRIPAGLKPAYSYSTVIAGREVEGVLMEVLGGESPGKK
ncbi:MAG: hypothetical protein K2Y39_11135 [Candidatus Obscuribacterales bacterium]|nr:hypothetical protein [Candidatus Obscuribacterales bacterium]